MSKVEVMVACMNQVDDSLYRQMNLHSDCILANQADSHSYQEFVQPDGNTVKLITSFDRGVGKNRNKAMQYATGEYVMCADQDMIYDDNYPELVEEAFRLCPKADMIIFRLRYLNRFTKGYQEVKRFKRVHLWNSMRYGTARVAMRKSAIDKACLCFSPLFGGGAKYSAGEDTLFIRDAFRKKLKIYASPVFLGTVKQEQSSWFTGYHDKYFIDKGILLANAFPVMKHLLVYYFAFRLRNVSKDYNFWSVCKLIRQGYREFRNI